MNIEDRIAKLEELVSDLHSQFGHCEVCGKIGSSVSYYKGRTAQRIGRSLDSDGSRILCRECLQKEINKERKQKIK